MSIYVFGYGSLINKSERDQELTASVNKRKIYPVMVTGLKRSFNVTSTGGKYKVLGVKESSDPTNKCNGVLFKIHHEEEMANLLRREKNYTPKPIDPKRILFEYKKQFVFKPADRVICFFPQAKHVLLKKIAKQREIRPTYLNLCLAGAAEQGSAFLQDFRDTTLDLL